MTKDEEWHQKFLNYLEEWPDSSLEKLALVYTGDFGKLDLGKIKDNKLTELFNLIEHLEKQNKHDELYSIRYAIARLLTDLVV